MENNLPNSASNATKSLVALIKTLYKGMPFLMISFSSLIIFLLTKLSANANLMIIFLDFIIILSSICVYSKSNNYGEAFLSLSAGLLTIYSVEWTISRFWSFTIIWLLFTLIVFLITAIKSASKIESIFTQAVIFMPDAQTSNKELFKKQLKELENISNSINDSILMPTERAEIIRFFCFKKMDKAIFATALKWVNCYYSITQMPYMDIALFVTEVIRNTPIIDQEITIDNIFDYIYTGMRGVPVSPSEYIDGFKKTKYVLASTNRTVLYFKALNDFFSEGRPISIIEDYINNRVSITA